MRSLRKSSSGEVLTYTFLADHLQDYANPRGKISRLVRDGVIIRVKKGLYVFGTDYRNAPINRGVLANLIYGPSYVSGMYALSQHGLIPERVETVTSMTTQRNRTFETPFGQFEYQYLNFQRYIVGVDWKQVNDREHCLFASPEKALADVVARERNVRTREEMVKFLLEDLRVEEDMLSDLDQERMIAISSAYRNPQVRLLLTALQELKDE